MRTTFASQTCISAAPVNKNSSAASFFNTASDQFVCSFPYTQISSRAPRHSCISPLSLSFLWVPCVLLTFNPKHPPPLVWNCYANEDMLLVFPLSAFLSAVVDCRYATGPLPPNQIKSCSPAIHVFPPYCNP